MMTLNPANDQRNRDVATRLAAAFEHVGRLLSCLDQGNWDSARDHLSLIAQHATIADVSLNSGSPDARRVLADVRERLPEQWADVIARFVAGDSGPVRPVPLVPDGPAPASEVSDAL